MLRDFLTRNRHQTARLSSKAPASIRQYSRRSNALIEALAQEVKDFGIKVTAIEPGMFRTDWIGRSLRRVEPTISDYDALRKRHDETPLPWNGDLAKAAQAMLTIIAAENPPGHVLLGSIADRLVGQKLENLRKEFATGEELSAWTDAVQLTPMP